MRADQPCRPGAAEVVGEGQAERGGTGVEEQPGHRRGHGAAARGEQSDRAELGGARVHEQRHEDGDPEGEPARDGYRAEGDADDGVGEPDEGDVAQDAAREVGEADERGAGRADRSLWRVVCSV